MGGASGAFRNRSVWLPGICHWLFYYHLNLSRYHFVLIRFTCPHVLYAAPKNRSRPDWDSLTVSVFGVVGDEAICMIFELSMKQYPTSFIESWEINILKTAPFPKSCRQFSRGVLTISHISGAAPFPCPRPCGGGGFKGRSHLSPTKVVSDSLKDVPTKCSIFLRGFNVHMIRSLGVIDRCMLKEAMV